MWPKIKTIPFPFEPESSRMTKMFPIWPYSPQVGTNLPPHAVFPFFETLAFALILRMSCGIGLRHNGLWQSEIEMVFDEKIVFKYYSWQLFSSMRTTGINPRDLTSSTIVLTKRDPYPLFWYFSFVLSIPSSPSLKEKKKNLTATS